MEKDKLKEILLQRKLELNHNYDKNLLNLNLALLGFLSLTFLTNELIVYYINIYSFYISFFIMLNFVFPMLNIALIQFLILANDQKIIDNILCDKFNRNKKLELCNKRTKFYVNILFFVSIFLTILNIIIIKGETMKDEKKINNESLDNLTEIYENITQNTQMQIGDIYINIQNNKNDNDPDDKK